MDVDRDDPGPLQRAQVGQGQILVGYGAGAVDWLTIVDDQQNMQALWPLAWLVFSLAQTRRPLTLATLALRAMSSL